MQAMRSAGPALTAGREWAEAHCQMAPEVREAAQTAGAFLLTAPVELGGWEASLPDLLAAFEEIAASDPTVAWHAANSQGVGLLAARLAADTRDRTLTSLRGPFAFSAAVKGVARAVDGGYVLSGRWPTVTGALDAQMALLAGQIPEGDLGPSSVRFFLVPSEALSIERTWDDAPAMRGTGSHAVTIDGWFVAEDLVTSPADPLVIDRPLYRVPFGFSGPVVGAAIAVGIVRAALAHVIELIAHKTSSLDGRPLMDRHHYPSRLAQIDSAVRAMSASLQSMAQQVWADAERGRPSRASRAEMWSTAYWVMDLARHTTSDLLSVGSSGVYSDLNPAHTGLRDLHAIIAAHAALRDYEVAAGRVLLGHPPELPGF